MKPSFTLFIAGMLIALSASSQTFDFSPYLKSITIDEKNITILRVPETKFSSNILGHISNAQSLLNDLKYTYKKTMGHSDNPNFGIEHSCQEIEKAHPTFPVRYYREELKAYRNVYDGIKQKEEDERNARIAAQKAFEENQKIERLKTGYFWINRDSINVRSKPNSQALIIGQIFRLSYVRAYDVPNKPDWAEIEFGQYGQYTGYVLGKYIADDWDALKATADDSASLVSGPHIYFIANEANLAKAKKETAQKMGASGASRSGGGKKYHLGPRGGCYFINSSGNKQYVARSYCND